MRRSLLLLLGLTLGWVSAMGSNFTLKTGYAAMDPVLVKAQNTQGILGNSTVFGTFLNLNSLAAPTPYGNSGDGGLTLTFDAVAGCNTDISWTAPTVSTAGYSLVVDSSLLVFDPLGSNDTISLGVAPPNPYTTTFGIGTYRARYVVRETATNALTYVVINMNVVDPIAPTLTIAADTSDFVNTATECTYVGVVTPVASATDNCTLAAGIELKMTVTDVNGTVLYRDTADGTGAWNLDTLATVPFPLDTTRILITATDASGNITSKDSIAVVVTDTELPVWDVPFDNAAPVDSNYVTSVDATSLCGIQGGIADVPTATDNCGNVTITFGIYDGTMTLIDTSSSGVDLTNYFFPVGTTTIIYYAQDDAGNYAATDYTLNVIVADDEAPIITAVNDFDFGPYPTSNNGTGDCSADVVIPNLAVSDLCSNGSQMIYEYRVNGGGWILNDSIIETLDADTHLIEYQVTDLAGNTSAIESFQIVVFDDELPTADLTVDTYTLYPQLTCDTLAIIESPITNDNCQINPTEWYRVFGGDTLDQGTGSIAALAYGFGTHTVLWHVEDTAGNAVDLTSTVTVADTLAPVVDGITRVDGDSITDIVGDGDGTYGDPFQLYTSDSVGCTPSIILSFDALDQCAIKVLSNSWNNDVHNLTGFAQATDSVFKLENLPVNYGDTTKIFIYAEDTVGNVGISDTIYVLVNDDEAPNVLATGTNDTIVGNNVGLCSKELTFNALTSFGANDTCGIDSIIVRVTPGILYATDTIYNGPVANSNFTFAFPAGITTVDYTASDLADNISTTETFTVEVNDTENPQIFAQDTVTVALAASVCAQTTVNLTVLGVDVLDNCSDTTALLASIVNTRTPNGADASGLYPLGITPVTFTVTDDAGNVASKTVYVEVIDVTGPAFASLPLVERFADIAQCEATFKLQIPASTDACGIDTVKYTINGVTTVLDSATLANGFTNAETFGKDTTIVTWTIVDASGLSTSGEQKVVVTDSQNPVIPAIANQTFSNDAGLCASTQTLSLPTGVTDNCEVDSLFFVIDGTKFGNNQDATFAFDAGTTVVTVIAKDETGNADTTMFDVVVNDTEAPVIACPIAGLTVDGDGASCDADFILRSLVPVTDNCSDSASISFAVTAVNNATSAVTSFNGNVSQTLSVGTYTVTSIATDAAANKDTCVFQLTVNNTANTVVTGFPADITVYALANECSRIVTWSEPTASNPCTGPVTVTGSHAPGDEFPLGTTDVVYNFGSFNDTLQITVLDTAKPVITNIPSVLNLTLGAGCEVAANYNVDVQDNCDAQGLDVTYTYEPGTLLGVGSYTNIVTVTDASGNTVSGQFTINVTDVTNPTLSASVSSITVCIGSPLNYTITANDNCPTGLVVDYSNTNLQPGNVPTATANETVSITATDAAGNTSTVSVNVVVLPAPTVADAGVDETVNVGNVQLNGNTPGAGENGTWTVVGGTGVFSNNTISNPAVTGISEGLNIFRYTISSSTCGSTSDDVAITYELPINVGENAPTVFTPNGDGVNDVWNIPGLDPTTYPNAKVTVFNRWGNPVFESDLGYSTPWDGTFEGSELPVASYYYVIDLGDGSDALSGVISIIR